MPASLHRAAIAALGLLFATAPAAAQSGPCPAANVAVVRMSKIKPGAMGAFRKAVADHSKWYADHGYPGDRQLIAPVLVPGADGAPVAVASDQVMTVHTHATSVPMAKHDAAWDAYVAEYRAISDLIGTTLVCLPM